jgi:hypothetical protein
MDKFQESAAKDTVRQLLKDGCEHLQRGKLTYLGLPAEKALDIKVLHPLLENVICVADKRSTLDETRRSIAMLPLKEKRFECTDMWNYLIEKYPAEPLLADVTYLDFYGGIKDANPMAIELHGLRSYFAKHARYPKRAFVFAWTYNPRDDGKEVYLETCDKIIPESDLKLLHKSTGVWLRTLAVRLILRQSLKEHGMSAIVYHHAWYKKAMNTIIVVYSKNDDPSFRLQLSDPDCLLQAPVIKYEPGLPVPRVLPLPTT